MYVVLVCFRSRIGADGVRSCGLQRLNGGSIRIFRIGDQSVAVLRDLAKVLFNHFSITCAQLARDLL